MKLNIFNPCPYGYNLVQKLFLMIHQGFMLCVKIQSKDLKYNKIFKSVDNYCR